MDIYFFEIGSGADPPAPAGERAVRRVVGWGGWRACDNPCHGENPEGQWASPDAQRKHRSWPQILSLYASG